VSKHGRPRHQTPPAGKQCFVNRNIINIIYINACTLNNGRHFQHVTRSYVLCSVRHQILFLSGYSLKPIHSTEESHDPEPCAGDGQVFSGFLAFLAQPCGGSGFAVCRSHIQWIPQRDKAGLKRNKHGYLLRETRWLQLTKYVTRLNQLQTLCSYE
jgi:hypothetical protein